MPALAVYRLTFPSGLHVGARGVNLEESSVDVSSDTLFAALLDAYRRDGSDPDRFVTPFLHATSPRNPPFLLSSAFPFAGEIKFFPMPVLLQCVFSAQTLRTRRKEIQKIRYVSEALWRRMLDRDALDDWLFPQDRYTEPRAGVALQGGTLWLTLDECQQLPTPFRRDLKTSRSIRPRALPEHKVYAAARVPRVTVDRVGSASTIFHAGRVTFAPGCGLWFGVEWRTPQAEVGDRTYGHAFRRTLALLGDDGLGGERTAGYGAFRCNEGATLSLPDAHPGNLALLLSRYHPMPEELPQALQGDGAGYKMNSVAGWLRSWDGAAQRRKRLWLVAEGSAIWAKGNGPWGDVTDVRPTYEDPASDFPHPVWRYGLALAAGLKEA